LEQEIRGGPALLELPPTAPATTDLLHLVSGVAQGRFVGDLWAFEQAVFALMLSWSRALAHQRLPSGPCEALLDSVRTHLRQHPPGFVAVEDLAAAAGMSRSRYTRHFTAITGWSPAAFIAHVRLEQVRHDLMNGNDTLDRLAERHGFADANHLCKAFRRAFAITPGIFRQQTRGQRATEQGA
jgi:AraC-like DNA-binding protein